MKKNIKFKRVYRVEKINLRSHTSLHLSHFEFQNFILAKNIKHAINITIRDSSKDGWDFIDTIRYIEGSVIFKTFYSAYRIIPLMEEEMDIREY